MAVQENEHLPAHFGKFPGADRLPLMTVVWVSNVCNASCGHCPFTLKPELRKKEKNPFMSRATFQRIVDDLGAEPDRVLRMTGTGEPLLNPFISDFVRAAKEKGITVGLITNGALLKEETASKLLALNIDIIEVSIDAMDAETYADIRRGLTYETVAGQLERCVELRNMMQSPTRVIASVIQQPDKLKNVEETVAYWQGIVDKVLTRKWITWNVLEPQKDADPFLDPNARVACPWLFDRLHITTDGDALICADDLDRQFKLGNVHDLTIQEIWNSEGMQNARQLHLDQKFDEISICKRCQDWPFKSWTYHYHKTVNEFKS